MRQQSVGTDRAVHVGWIGAEWLDREHLVSLGVDVGAYDRRRHCFEVSVNDAALRALAGFSGVYNWGLQPESRWSI